MNLRDVDLSNGGAQLGNAVIPLSKPVLDAAAAADLSRITLGVRPESFHVASNGAADVLKLHVNLVEELGADAFVHGTLPEEDELNAKQIIVRFDGRVPPRVGEIIDVEIRTGEEHAFNPETGERLG
jgi:multiple sugar transport system ATP-binding protein